MATPKPYPNCYYSYATMIKRGKDQLFAKTRKAPDTEKLLRHNICLTAGQIDYMDELALRVKRATGLRLSHSEIVRMLLETLIEANPEVEKLETPQDLKRLLQAGQRS